ncbi:hypothetical protein GTV15_00230, partial [Streptomyces sp. SID7803]|nr:hypothetical protein [Streptomyces sp. SID7803]
MAGNGCSSHDFTAHSRPVRLQVFPLCLGGNVFGWTADEDRSFAVLDAYAAAGGNFVDTADAYSHWFPATRAASRRRSSASGSRRAATGPTSWWPPRSRAPPRLQGPVGAHDQAAAEESLRRLNTDYIDLYYTHFDDETVPPVEEIITALDQLVKEGKVREIAASNISAERLRASVEFSEREGLARYVALQPHYNLVSRDTYEANSRTPPRAPGSPPSRTSRWPPDSSPASTARGNGRG